MELHQHSMLKGNELIEFVQANPGISELDLARGAGYSRTTTSGKLHILKKAFMTELLAANGLKVGAAPSRLRGKTAQYITTVHANGVILLGKTYSEDADLSAGDRLQITTTGGEIRITLLERAGEVDAMRQGLEATLQQRHPVAA